MVEDRTIMSANIVFQLHLARTIPPTQQSHGLFATAKLLVFLCTVY